MVAARRLCSPALMPTAMTIPANPRATTLTSAKDLAATGLIAQDDVANLEAVAARYAIAITPTMAELIPACDPSGPIASQFIPSANELLTAPEESEDPLEDQANSPIRGIVHRYADRVLLKPIHVCPVYCRFCFRRAVVGPDGEGGLTSAELQAALAWVDANPAIWEVILTGGDPFILSARRAAQISQALGAIDHVKIVRWHTRVPIVDPMRVTPDFVQALKADGITTWVALHANHADEFTTAARHAIARLIDAGIPLVSQSVLLKGVNDTVDALEALMRTFVENRIKPYYLHQGDLAPGTSHFRTGIEAGRALMAELRIRASGLAQPAYVQDSPGQPAKTLL